MLDRLAGLESEYAIRYAPGGGVPRPGHDLVHEAIEQSLGGIVHTCPGMRRALSRQVFLENGGSVYYEAVPRAISGGLIEGGTPECRGPGQLLRYQRAQDLLLERSLGGARKRLTGWGHPGTLGLLKNCRDAEGHVYGAQENYDAEVARGAALFFYRLGLVLLIPLLLTTIGLAWGALAGLLVLTFAIIPLFLAAAILAGIFGGIIPPLGRWLDRVTSESGERSRSRSAPQSVGARVLFAATQWLELVVSAPLVFPFVTLLRATAFRPFRREAMAFLVTRPIFTGAGTTHPLGEAAGFTLSEKATVTRRPIRATPLPVDRAILDTGNLLKRAMQPATLNVRPYLRLFGRRQRLQLGLSDSNMAQVAEYLKIGTTMLVLDMVESGWLRDRAPRLARPIQALSDICGDPSLSARVELTDGTRATALDLQRRYLDLAETFVLEAKTTSLEAREVVRLWRSTLDALEIDPAGLVGRVDWVTKRWLLAEAGGPDATDAVRKKIDLRYHELGTGYFARLEREGLAPTLVPVEELEGALRTPPQDTPAWQRGQLVRRLCQAGTTARFSWESVRVGGPVKGKLIRLDDHRRRGEG